MSQFYNPKKSRGLFNPLSDAPFKISRSKIDLFLNCPRCFYLDTRLGVGRPPGFPFNLNSAVDKLLKKEFDIHRADQTPHPLMKAYGIKAVPFAHKMMDTWRENFKGVQYLHEETNLLVTGAVDDVWINPEKELIVVDYKATSKEASPTLDAPWQIGYKRQAEVYQWLLRQNGFKVSDMAYFVYCNGKTDREAFDGKLEFDVVILPYEGKAHWIDTELFKIKELLLGDEIPRAGDDCDYCHYRAAAGEVE
ncbi:MAG: PD-(D/E)XK nuclease family protein [Patescibacteria group bacterium]|nr:PD-(D/E)XK nuclease family protein [Patescibacteria group bacterium]